MKQERKAFEDKAFEDVEFEPTTSTSEDLYTLRLAIVVALLALFQQSPFREMTSAEVRDFTTIVAIVLVLPLREVSTQVQIVMQQLSRKSTQAQSPTVLKTADEVENGDD